MRRDDIEVPFKRKKLQLKIAPPNIRYLGIITIGNRRPLQGKLWNISEKNK